MYQTYPDLFLSPPKGITSKKVSFLLFCKNQIILSFLKNDKCKGIKSVVEACFSWGSCTGPVPVGPTMTKV